MIFKKFSISRGDQKHFAPFIIDGTLAKALRNFCGAYYYRVEFVFGSIYHFVLQFFEDNFAKSLYTSVALDLSVHVQSLGLAHQDPASCSTQHQTC
jgi:hypothetical protein